MKLTTPTRTAEVLAEMLTENTGRHMLDSGGAYGRHWEKNTGRTVQNFLDAPAVNVDEWGATLDVFHYLLARVEFAPEMHAEFEEFAKRDPEASWLQLCEDFPSEYGFEVGQSFNTYNFENLLSQTLQGVTFSTGEDCFVLLQIHGGADVRGGYTAPKVFKVTTYDMPEAFYWDAGDFVASCPKDHEHSIHVQHGEVIDWGGSLLRHELQFDEAGLHCPTCGEVMEVGACEPC